MVNNLRNLYESMTTEQLENTLIGMQEQITYLICVLETRKRRKNRRIDTK